MSVTQAPDFRDDGTKFAFGLTARLGVFLALAILLASHRSLWLDEFHSLFHARSDGFGELFSRLRQDNHAPLYFLTLWITRAFAGETELALRMPAILFGYATVALVVRLARLVLPRPAANSTWTAALLAAVSSLLLTVSAEARMYSLLSLCVIGLLYALLAQTAGRLSWKLVALWTLAGLHTHYYFLHFLFVMGLAWIVAIARLPHLRAGARQVVAGVAVGCVASLPWYLWGFLEQISDEVGPGQSTLSLAQRLTVLLRLFFYNTSLGGPAPLQIAYKLGAVVALGLALVGLVRMSGAEPREGRSDPRATAWLLGAAAFGVPVWAALLTEVVPRSGFNWTYLAPSVAPMAVLVGASTWSSGSLSRFARAGVLFVGLSALTLSAFTSVSSGTENYRGAVEHVLRHDREGDAVIVCDWMPELFPHDLSWEYYAPRESRGDEPTPELATTADWDLAQPERLAEHPRVWLVDRGLPGTAPLRARLESGRVRAEYVEFGYSLRVARWDLAQGATR